MGRRYGDALSRMFIPYNYVDPKVKTPSNLKFNKRDSFKYYTHAIITTPSESHYKIYDKIKEEIVDENILIVKPVVVDKKHVDLFDKNIFHGMSERYNEAFIKFRNFHEDERLHLLRFDRYVKEKYIWKEGLAYSKDEDAFTELAIHDFDLAYQMGFDLMEMTNLFVLITKNLYLVSGLYNDTIIQFNGGFVPYDCREIVAIKAGETSKVDLYYQKLTFFGDSYAKPIDNKNLLKTERVFNFSNSLEDQIKDFISGKNLSASEAHFFMFHCMDQNQYMLRNL